MGVNERQNRTVLFVHIPKTAGTTLRVLFLQQYTQQPIFVIGNHIQRERQKLDRMKPPEKRALRLVFGHQCWGWHESLAPGQNYAYTTMLREPRERVLSLYSHCRLWQHYLGESLKGRDIEYFLTSGITGRADNAMVRQLCGRDWFAKQEARKDTAIPLGGVTQDDLKAAIAHLDECALVGTAESFDAYLEAGRGVFGWRMTAYRKENVTIWPRVQWRDLTRRQQAAVDKSTELDRVLYEHAKKVGAK